VRDRPEGLADGELKLALASGWRIAAKSLRYAAVGGGSYHWVASDSERRRWFVTVDDLDGKGWLGQGRDTVFCGLRAAMDTAGVLRHHAGLRFVVAPVPSLAGETVRRLGSRYAVAVFPFLGGTVGDFGEVPPAPERDRVLVMLAALHRATPAVTRPPASMPGLPYRGALERALADLGRPWRGGPFSEQARALLSESAQRVQRLLATFDELAGRVAAAGGDLVITHGEPHPGNILRAGDDRMLIDWDTVGLAPPERDLWLLASASGGGLDRYTEVAGRPVSPDALALYRLRWALDDTSSFVQELRATHSDTPGARHAWQALKITLAGVAT
jgi:spectinomycin phosphotransferase